MTRRTGGPSLGGAAGRSTLELAALEVGTLFVLSPLGRIVRENDPDASRGPRFYLGGSPEGNAWAIHEDVPPETTRALDDLAMSEPPLGAASGEPRHVDEYRALLGPDVNVTTGLAYVLDVPPHLDPFVPLVRSGTPEGARLVDRLARNGMPEALRESGFASTTDFWEPWCVALYEEGIGAITFTSRLGDEAVEAGTVTVPALRRRGLATAATAGWATHPDLEERVRFYSTAQANAASQRVARRLGARFVGATYRIE